MTLNLAFYTVTNRRYFPGTVAALSSIRLFYPDRPIFVYAEVREELTPEQEKHLSGLKNVVYRKASEISNGSIREAWQMKAHAAYDLLQSFNGVLIHIDSDAVLCSAVNDVAKEVYQMGVPAGGRDGQGARYDARTHYPYTELCGVQSDGNGFNSNYISTSVLFLPLPNAAEVIEHWSRAVDEACFGPQPSERKRFPGHGDQGVFNAILYFKGIRPLVLDNAAWSEHWVHGAVPISFRDGRFWKESAAQRAFHSVGNVPKFWRREYSDLASKNANLQEVYLYWLYLVFDGPCGFLEQMHPDHWKKQADLLAPCFRSQMLETFQKLRQPRLRRIINDFGYLGGRGEPAQPLLKSSDNLLCAFAFDGYLDHRKDVHFLYSAVRRFQNYRQLGGEADLVIFANRTCLDSCAPRGLLETAARYRVSIVESSSSQLRELFLKRGIDVERLRKGCLAWLDDGKRDGRFLDGVDSRYGILVALEVYIGRLLLVAEWAKTVGYERCAMIDADGGRYSFNPDDVPPECSVDDIWKFDEFTDLVYQETSTGKADFHQISNQGVRELFNLRASGAVMPMFQTNGHWVQGTTRAFSRYVELAIEEVKRFYLLGYYPDDESVTTAVILRSALWPEYGSMAGHSLRRQIEVANGIGEPWYRPFYAEKEEEKYTRRFLSAPRVARKCAICIAAFNNPAECATRKYSKAAWDRVSSYRELLKGTADIHVFTDDLRFPAGEGLTIHLTSPEELITTWDRRATFAFMMELQHEAVRDSLRHKDGHFLKRPEYAPAMIAKIVAVEQVMRLGYDTVLSADADGMQFSRDTIGALGRMHIDGIWAAANHHPFMGYIVGTGQKDSFNVWLSLLKEVSGVKGADCGPVDWIWGPCWMMNADFGGVFMPLARAVFQRILDMRIVCYDEHILNCTYNLAQFDANPFGGIRDLGDAALVGYREMNPRCFLRYKRWSTNQPHTGRKHRPKLWYHKPDFEYAY